MLSPEEQAKVQEALHLIEAAQSTILSAQHALCPLEGRAIVRRLATRAAMTIPAFKIRGGKMEIEEFSDLMEAEILSGKILRITVDPLTAMVIIKQLQLALRHPDNAGPTRRITETFIALLATQFSNGDVQNFAAQFDTGI